MTPEDRYAVAVGVCSDAAAPEVTRHGTILLDLPGRRRRHWHPLSRRCLGGATPWWRLPLRHAHRQSDRMFHHRVGDAHQRDAGLVTNRARRDYRRLRWRPDNVLEFQLRNDAAG